MQLCKNVNVPCMSDIVKCSLLSPIHIVFQRTLTCVT